MPLLTDEELMALEEDLLARERGAPIAMPEADQTPAILPPGPSLEYLRRAHEMGPGPTLPDAPPKWGRGALTSFDPATGQTESFTTISPPSNRSEYLEQIRNQINATEFKTQADALNAAIQFQHMREFQRLSDAGVPPEQALLRTGPGMFGKNPNVIAPLINATRPVPSPAVTNIGGVNVLRSGLRGERATAVPQSALPQQTMKPEVLEVEGERVIRLGPNRWQYLGKTMETKELPPSVEASIYKFTIDKAAKALDLIPSKKTEERQALQNEIQQATENLKAMVKGRIKAAPSERVKVISPTGKRGDIPRSQLDEAIAGGYKLQ